MVSGHFDQLQIISLLHLIELLGLLIGLGLLDRVRHPGVHHSRKSYEVQVGYLGLFRLFCVIDGFGWFLLGSLHKNIQLMLMFLIAPS